MGKVFTSLGYVEIQVKIPEEWSDFFTSLLLSPSHFLWAKNFLSSQAIELLYNSRPELGIKFSIPSVCPNENATPPCTHSQTRIQIEEFQQPPEQENSHMSTPESITHGIAQGSLTTSPILLKHKKLGKKPLVETDVRRSDRIQKVNRGFKGMY